MIRLNSSPHLTQSYYRHSARLQADVANFFVAQGADTVIYERLAPDNAENNSMKAVTREHMEEYGAAGLRTLCLAYCELDKAAYDS